MRGGEQLPASLVENLVNYDFPNELTLTTITLSPTLLSLTWHLGNSGWARAKSKDFQQDEGDDTFRYDAYRLRFDRNVVRFEWQFAKIYCAIFIQLPNDGNVHEDAIERVWANLHEIGIVGGGLNKVGLSPACKALSRNADIVVRSARMMASGGHVDLVSTLRDGGISDVEPVRQVQLGVDDSSFSSADGMFEFKPETLAGLSRSVKVQGYGLESRLRVWVQCKREDVYLVIDLVWASNQP